MLWWKTFWRERQRCPPPSCTVTSTASSHPAQQAARSWRSSSGWEILPGVTLTQEHLWHQSRDEDWRKRRSCRRRANRSACTALRSSLRRILPLWSIICDILVFASCRQLLTQCNLRFVECFSAHKDSNKEKNRNSSVVPCEYPCFKHSMVAVSFNCWLILLPLEIKVNIE